MKIELNPDWSEFLRLLISRRVRFLLIGGHAVAGHAEPRMTEDLDVFVQPTLANAARLREVLLAFGFDASTPPTAELAVPGKVWMIGRKPWRIDILTRIDGVTFAECWRGRVRAEFGNGELPVIGRAELIRNKRASGRQKDLADIEALVAFAPVRGRPGAAASPGAVQRKKSRSTSARKPRPR